MVTRANLDNLFIVSVILLAMAGTTFAGPLLCPMHVGLELTYQRTNGTVTWSVVQKLAGMENHNSMDYYQLESSINGGAYELVDIVRSTEDALYSYNPSGDDYLQFQGARVGTRWTFYEEHGGLNYKVIEIVAIERVTVPYGTFNKAYKHRKYRCATPEGANPSPDWYEWIVPGVGVVKQVDYWTGGPPEIMELVNISSELKNKMADTLVFFDASVDNGALEGVGKGKGKKQLNSLKKMLETAAELIEDGFNDEACEQFTEALSRCDGDNDPPDYVTGDAINELANKIQDVINGLKCQ
jgi:hypothetical protein